MKAGWSPFGHWAGTIANGKKQYQINGSDPFDYDPFDYF
jgi:hypothetical protein